MWKTITKEPHPRYTSCPTAALWSSQLTDSEFQKLYSTLVHYTICIVLLLTPHFPHYWHTAFGDDTIVAAAHSQEAGKAIGLVQMFNESVGRCDPDLRRDLFSNIILTGGGSLFDGLEVRVHNELAETLPSQKIRIVASGVNTERRSVDSNTAPNPNLIREFTYCGWLCCSLMVW